MREEEHGTKDGEALNILLAEDDDLNAEIVEWQLKARGVKLVRARDGREAVALFRDAPSETYAAVLMDIIMPGMDGCQAAREIRRLEKNRKEGGLPIVAMTGSSLPEDVQSCLDAGMDAYLTKPCSPELMLRTISGCLEKRRRREALEPPDAREEGAAEKSPEGEKGWQPEEME